MYCLKCGKEINDDAVFCGYCGARQQPTAEPGGYPPGGVGYNGPFQPAEPAMPMKWYKFIIYFQLFAFAVLSIIGGVGAITGSAYQGYAEYVYDMYTGMQALDIIYAVCCFLLAGFAIYTRQELVNFKSTAIKRYFTLLIANIVVYCVYVAAVSIITAIPIPDLMNGFQYGFLGGVVFMLLVNITYFNKRRHLFVN